MKVSNEIDVHEIDFIETKGIITIESHWNLSEFIVIHAGGQSFTVKAGELEKAIKNATNWRVW